MVPVLELLCVKTVYNLRVQPQLVRKRGTILHRCFITISFLSMKHIWHSQTHSNFTWFQYRLPTTNGRAIIRQFLIDFLKSHKVIMFPLTTFRVFADSFVVSHYKPDVLCRSGCLSSEVSLTGKCWSMILLLVWICVCVYMIHKLNLLHD